VNHYPLTWLSIPSLVAAVVAVLMAVIAGFRAHVAPIRSSLVFLFIAIAFQQGAVTIRASSEVTETGWARLVLLTQIGLPSLLLYVNASLMRMSGLGAPSSGNRWLPRPMALAALGLGGTIVTAVGSVEGAGRLSWRPDGDSWLAMAIPAYMAVALTLGMVQLEHILRASGHAIRYQMKFLIVGLAVLAAYDLTEAVRWLTGFPRPAESSFVHGTVTLCAMAVMAVTLVRMRSSSPGPTLEEAQGRVPGIVTLSAIGAYVAFLVFSPGAADHVELLGSPDAGTLAMFAGVLALALGLLSRRVQVRLSQISAWLRFRSKYDYRAKWLEVTEAFHAASSVDAILNQLIRILARTFEAPKMSIWMRFDADGRFHQVRTVNTDQDPKSLDAQDPLVRRLQQSDEPVVLGQAAVHDADIQAFGSKSQACVCVPIRGGRELRAFVTMSAEGAGVPLDREDCQLLKALADHAGMLLAHASLSEEVQASAEFDALHRVAAFCLHDLKNLTSQLSLVVQNAEAHGQDPRFQKSAMRTVSGTVKKMMGLMVKLSLGTSPHADLEEVNVHSLIAETVRGLDPRAHSLIKQLGESVPSVRMPREQFQQVLFNVILNAWQASGDAGEIKVTTKRHDGYVRIAVTDNGPGIPIDRLRTLFQPFRSTKKDGLGLGLYECRRILAAYGGSIGVESETGKGTRVTIELPVAVRAMTSAA
jgi:putative PEP-CTERM system histidine kinase